MKLAYREIKYSGEWAHIEPLGDIHVGNPACDEQKFIQRVEAIKKDKNRYWIGMGDYVDNIRPWKRGVVDKRWETNLLAGEADWVAQWERFVEIVEPITNKCLGFLWGNHVISGERVESDWRVCLEVYGEAVISGERVERIS